MLTGVILLAAIAIGSVFGIAAPGAAESLGDFTDPLIFALVTLLLTGLRVGGLGSLRRAPRTVATALALNFLVVPVVAFTISSVIMVDADALRVGVLLYCLFPCTDWFLGFTRLSDGDTVVGSALIPVNMAIQLALFPIYLHVLTDTPTDPLAPGDWTALLHWFALPAGIAIGARVVVHLVGRRKGTRWLVNAADTLVAPVLALLVAGLFATNIGTVVDHPVPFLRVLATVFCFLAATYAIGEYVTRRMRFDHPQRALIVMTTSARNAPLILALTVVALPDEPMIHAAIVLGMLVEFPHLTALRHLLLRSADRAAIPETRVAPVAA